MKINRMFKVTFPKILRRPLSDFLFFVARRHFKNRGGVFEQLRALADFGKVDEYIKKMEDESLKSDVSHLSLVGVRLIELYSQDTLPSLQAALRRAFPDEDDDIGFQARFISDWQTTGYSRIGSISPKSKSLHSFKPNFRSLKFPKEISQIEVTYYRFLPSLVGIAYDVFFTKEAREKHAELMVHTFEPESDELTGFYPFFKVFAFSGRIYSIGAKRKAPFWLEDILDRTRSLLNETFEGFSIDYLENGIPATEIYSFEPAPVVKKDWVTANYRFLSDFGISPSAIYANDKILFCWGERPIGSTKRTNNKVILFPGEGRGKLEKESSFSEYSLMMSIWGYLSDWFPYLASLYFLDIVNYKLEKFRVEILEKMGRKRANLNVHAELLQEFQKNYYLLQALKHDAADSILKKARVLFFGDSNLPYLSLSGTANQNELLDSLVEVINKYNDRLLSRNALLKDWYTGYLALQNTSATYRIAILALLVSALALILSEVDVSQLVNNVIGTLRGFLSP